MKRKLMWVLVVALLAQPWGAEAARRSDHSKNIQREYYDNGHLRLELRVKAGVVTRKRLFYRNGQCKYDYRYKNGELVKAANYFENGQLQSIWTKKSGETKFYHPDGKLRTVVRTSHADTQKSWPESLIFSGGK